MFRFIRFKKGKEVMARIKLSDEDFVRKYMTCNNLNDLYLVTGIKHPGVRAAKLRKAGVNLPKYGRAAKVVDIAALNAIVLDCDDDD